MLLKTYVSTNRKCFKILFKVARFGVNVMITIIGYFLRKNGDLLDILCYDFCFANMAEIEIKMAIFPFFPRIVSEIITLVPGHTKSTFTDKASELPASTPLLTKLLPTSNDVRYVRKRLLWHCASTHPLARAQCHASSSYFLF
jgi:hypothetical protein